MEKKKKNFTIKFIPNGKNLIVNLFIYFYLQEEKQKNNLIVSRYKSCLVINL